MTVEIQTRTTDSENDATPPAPEIMGGTDAPEQAKPRVQVKPRSGGRPRNFPGQPPFRSGAGEQQPSDATEAPSSSAAATPGDVVSEPDIIPDKAKGKAKLPATGPLIEIRRREDQAVSDWLSALRSTGGAFKTQIFRIRPATWLGRNIKGLIDTTHDMVHEEDLKAQYGGGTYELRVNKRNEQGTYVYFAQTTFDIAGDPIVPRDPVEMAASQPRTDPLQARALDLVDRTIDRQERELATLRGQHGNGHSSLADLQFLMKPLQDELAALRTSLKDKDDQINRLLLEGNKQDPYQAKMLDKLIDGDTARVNTVRAALESEIRTVKENAREDEKRLRDQFDRDKQQMTLQHQREIDMIRSSHEREIAAMKMAFDTNKTVLDGEIRRLVGENNELRTEVKVLREKKDQTLIDKAKEVETFKELIGVGGDEAEKSTIEKIADAAFQSDKLFEVIGRWVGPKPAGAQQQAQQQQTQQVQHQPRVVRRRSDGQVFVRQANGEYAPAGATTRQQRAAKAPPPKNAAGDAQATDSDEIEVHVDPQEVAAATAFLELAFRNNVDMNALVTTLRSQIPPAVMTALADLGVDGFIAKVAKVPSTSPLATQAGRVWARKLGKALLGDGG